MTPTTAPALLQAVADAYELPVRALTGRGRRQYAVRARQAAMWLLRERYDGLSLVAVGELLGGRDHSTVSYGIEQVEQRRQHDSAFARRLDELLVLPLSPAPAAD